MRGAAWFVLFIFVLGIPSVSPASDIQNKPLLERIKLAQTRTGDSTREELRLFFEEKELVVATKHPISLKKAPAIATIITSDEIKNMGARNIMDVLKMVPGIGISINEFGRYMFEVRGIRTATSEKILVMIDGHRLNESYTGSALANAYNDLPVENIKQIEIIRGPGSALYGANAFVAVINIVTKDAGDIKGVNVSAAGGSFDTKKFNLLAGGSYEKLQVSGSVDYLNTNGPKLLIDKDRFAGRSYTAAPGRTDANLEKTDIFLKASYGNLTFKGQYTGKDRGAYIGNAYALTDENFITYRNFWNELSYNQTITESLSSNLRLYFDQFEQDAKVELFPEGFTSTAGTFPDGAFARALLKNRTLGAELQFDYELFEDNHLIIGGIYENIRQFDVKHFANFNPTTSTASLLPLGSFQDITYQWNFNKDAKREIWAAFIQDEWEIKDKLNITAGVRYDHYSDFKDTFNPRAAVVWGFMDKADLKLLYGQAFRAPNFVELYNANNPTVIGNPNLKPEKIRTYEAALGYRFTDNFKVDINYFINLIDDLIARDAAVSPAQYANKAGARVRGIEVELTGNYTLSNYWKASYTYQEPKDSNTKKRLVDVPSQRAAAGLNYGLSKYLISHIDVLWTGSRPRASGDTRGRIPSYTTVDLALIAKNIYKNLEIKGTVHNLLDKRYRDPDTSGSSKLIPNDFPREGISALISISYKF
ncbi:MAG: TonB-dependent receptor [Nitrospirae bacterium]|nr:TonB-dependent receptor [Nitrospirota bacterium]